MEKRQGTKTSLVSRLLVCTSLLFLFGCSSDSATTSPDSSASSAPPESDSAPPAVLSAEEKLYEMYCLNCHGEQLKGGYAPKLEGIGNKFSEEELLKIMVEGIGKMPSQKYIPEEDQKLLAKWLAEQK